MKFTSVFRFRGRFHFRSYEQAGVGETKENMRILWAWSSFPCAAPTRTINYSVVRLDDVTRISCQHQIMPKIPFRFVSFFRYWFDLLRSIREAETSLLKASQELAHSVSSKSFHKSGTTTVSEIQLRETLNCFVVFAFWTRIVSRSRRVKTFWNDQDFHCTAGTLNGRLTSHD